MCFVVRGFFYCLHFKLLPIIQLFITLKLPSETRGSCLQRLEPLCDFCWWNYNYRLLLQFAAKTTGCWTTETLINNKPKHPDGTGLVWLCVWTHWFQGSWSELFPSTPGSMCAAPTQTASVNGAAMLRGYPCRRATNRKEKKKKQFCKCTVWRKMWWRRRQQLPHRDI